MNIPFGKKIVCITGSNWTGRKNAPRRLLVKDGFMRPTWFTTGRRFHDPDYNVISETQFHLRNAEKRVVAYFRYSRSYIGILQKDFEIALKNSERGVLIVGPPEIAEQIAAAIPKAMIFSLKSSGMKLSSHLIKAKQRGQLQRIDVNVSMPGAWTNVYARMSEKLGFPEKSKPF